ncbi:MAG: CGGC domain-containing protein [Desulfonatronovibrionaceae bacterium]
MSKIGLFRCADNERKCPLTSCFKSLNHREQGFAGYADTELVGVFTLQKDTEENLALAKILKAKGAEAIHLVTCAFARKGEGKTWHLGGGFIEQTSALAQKIAEATNLPCIKGSAHLPADYKPEIFNP